MPVPSIANINSPEAIVLIDPATGLPYTPGGGSVSSVGLALPLEFTVTNSPVTTSGTLTGAWAAGAAPASGKILVGNAGNTAYASVSVSGDATLSSTGALTVTKTNGNSFSGIATSGSASDLSAGTVPDSRFPATLPASSGVNLTALNATNLGSGTVPDARFPATLPAASGINLTALNATNIASGTLANARLPAAISVTNLDGILGANTPAAITATTGTFSGLMQSNQISITGNVSAAAWTTSGIGFKTVAATYTDTTSSGTVAQNAVHVISAPTLIASSATTYTSAVTFVISGAPVASTNVTIGTARAMDITGLVTLRTGLTVSGGNTSINSSSSTSTTSIGTGTTSGTVSIGGSANAIAMGNGITVAAGAVGAGKAPLKFTSGTNLTTAEAGAMEYNGTTLFFTRTGTTREGVLVGPVGASAPSTSVLTAFTNYYGTGGTVALSIPNTWFSVVGSDGATYKMPGYS